MKKLFSKNVLVQIFLLLLSQNLLAQKIEITPTYGYMFAGKMSVIEGDINIKNDANFGIILDIPVEKGMMAEISYSRLNTQTTLEQPSPEIDMDLGDLAVEYYHAGAVINVKSKGNIRPFGILTMGATRFAPQEEKYADSWMFSVSPGGGVKIFFTENIGIRLQARLLIPIYFKNGILYGGSGGGGFVVTAGIPIIQADVTAGLIIALGK